MRRVIALHLVPMFSLGGGGRQRGKEGKEEGKRRQQERRKGKVRAG